MWTKSPTERNKIGIMREVMNKCIQIVTYKPVFALRAMLWRHQMALLARCEGISPVTGKFLHKTSDAELWHFLWSAEQTVK